jgi:hypothetical protein
MFVVNTNELSEIPISSSDLLFIQKTLAEDCELLKYIVTIITACIFNNE